MSSSRLPGLANLLLRLFLGGLFLWSGVVKLADPKAFAAVISRYDLVPEPLLPVVAIGLPLLEVLAGLATALNRRGGLESVIAMLLLFIAVLWFGILHNLDIDCGCFSSAELGEQDGLRQAFIRDWVLLALAFYLLYVRYRHSRPRIQPHLKETNMKKLAIILFLAAALGASATAPAQAAWGKKELETEKIAATFAREVERGGYGIVTTDELNGWVKENKAMLIIDTMPFADSYVKQHIPGATQFEFPIPEMTEIDEATQAKFLELLGPDKDRPLVFYCGFTKCTRSHNGALWAVKLGYSNVYRCPGGIKAWDEAGFPVAKGEK